ncbi:bifunctional methylenetetrahydrofolate dehydrogenase/cyclohydrolase, mitochondrial [Harpegnathos saltator]|uniref:methenyltetrahydrofolate cyclohydrolase n=1 Tax=Harpegnathos saltator TaxID=610380 RepID=E2BT00_HARSA|nr:bifunctional methylenetetrahydrofolate dehydrogenase/cyclohydrolase, mitochondrial [Harpegnathos saltator]XP_019698384.1 bifunctional methylenetetrahydrofolate dehydrogenase/cyclohydrolase, mitochondrial [Harpegnathos saltator]EFN81188.1 Bifunctional methylenetetrahydrofolate dehydrogenase/cyclohydrolase, mitochondrial [Harpegnathos saltator]
MFSWRNVLVAVTKPPQRFARKLHLSKCRQEAMIINGQKVAEEIKKELKMVVDTCINAGKKRPKLVAILVGNHPSSKAYVDRKMKAAKFVGIESYTVHLGENITQTDLLKEINSLNRDPTVDGILVQLPLPKSMNEKEVCQAIIPKKDVDGFHLENIGNLTLDSRSIVPATALAVRELVIRSKIETFGKNAVVVGRSKHVGLPIALLLHSDSKGETGALDMTTTICHRHTPHTELEKFTKLADLVIVAAGVPGLITKEMVKPGACIIDVGITRMKTADGKYRLVGDVDYDSVKEVAGHITPVPGGVGPMTVAMLMRNTVAAAMGNQEDQIKQSVDLESNEAFI